MDAWIPNNCSNNTIIYPSLATAKFEMAVEKSKPSSRHPYFGTSIRFLGTSVAKAKLALMIAKA